MIFLDKIFDNTDKLFDLKIAYLLLMENKTRQELVKKVWINLINLSAYEFTRKNLQIFDRYASIKLQDSILNMDRDFRQSGIFKLALRAFCHKHGYILLIVPISLVLSLFARSSKLAYLIAGLCFFLVFAISFLIYGAKFAIWYSSIDSAYRLMNRMLNDISRRIEDFGNVSYGDRDRVIKKILKDIIERRKSGLSEDWRLFPYYSVIYSIFLSGVCFYIFSGEALLEAIRWVADIFNLENSETIKSIDVVKIFMFLFTGFSFVLGLAFFSSLKQMKMSLQDSLAKIENRTLI